jgi:hypothetical protein
MKIESKKRVVSAAERYSRPARFDVWLAKRSWTLLEASSLSLGLEPDPMDGKWADHTNAARDRPLAARYDDLVRASKVSSKAPRIRPLPTDPTPRQFIDWANQEGMQLPEQFRMPSTKKATSDDNGNRALALRRLVLGLLRLKFPEVDLGRLILPGKTSIVTNLLRDLQTVDQSLVTEKTLREQLQAVAKLALEMELIEPPVVPATSWTKTAKVK